MLQRAGMAQAMLGNPDLLFLDEPASGTDPLGVAIVRDRILDAKGRGATIVLNSHQLAEVERVCDRIVFIDRGHLTRTEALRGETATRRKATIRVASGNAVAAAALLSASGIEASASSESEIRLASGEDEALSRAVKALVLSDISVFQARSDADLEGLFLEKGET
jgi:ABC-2 type transport system ATP-binding protein